MSQEPKAGTGIDPEMLAAYIDKRLSPEQRAAVEAQLATDPDSYAVLVETIQAQDALNTDASAQVPEVRTVPEVPKGGVPRVRRWTMAAGVLATAAAIALVVWTQPDLLTLLRGERVDARFERLVAAVGDQRYVEARLTGGFHYGPLREVTRSAGSDLARQNLALLAASGEVQKEAQANASAENLGVLGIALLQLGDIDGAVAQLEQAVEIEPSGDRLSNLAAAYLSRAAVLQRDADMSLALETVERALAASPTLPEALYNRALILQKFRLTELAVKAWDAFLAVDDKSPWAEEARRNRAELLSQARNPTVAEAVQLVLRSPGDACGLAARDSLLMREVVEDVLLPTWADHLLSGTNGELQLLAAEQVGECLATHTPGALTPGAVKAIRRADHSGQRELALAHRLWRSGRIAYAKAAPDEFTPPFAEARGLFEKHGSPLSMWTRQYAVVGMFYRGQLEGAEHEISALEARPEVVPQGPLWARLQWLRGSIQFQRAAFGQSLVEYREALTAFEALREGEHVVAMYQSLAEAHGRLGLEREAWDAHGRALDRLESARDYRRIHSALTSPGYTAQVSGLYAAAFDFFSEGHGRAAAVGHTNYQFECEVGMGRALIALGRLAEAESIYRSALAMSAKVSNPSLRARHTSDIRAGLAEIASANQDYASSLKWIDEALNGLETVSSEYLVAMLHLQRGRTLTRLGRIDEAKAALARGIDVLESKRALLQQSVQRVAYTDRSWDLYGDIIALTAITQRHPEEALRWVDRSRARTIQDTRTTNRRSFDELLTPVLPNDRAVLVLAQTQDGLLLWLKHSRGIAFHVARTDIAERVTRAGDRLDDRLLSEAFRVIVGPFAEELRLVRRVTVVPDWATQSIPFAALIDGNEPWVFRTAIDLAPSVSLALAAVHEQDRFTAPQSIAVVTGAEAPSSAVPAALPGANDEARHIPGLYREAIALSGSTATVQALRTVMGRVDVLHVAMHARADGRYLDRFSLDIKDKITGLPLSAESILEGGRTPALVVLAACQTASGPRVRGEILMSLARPFMLAGTRHVLATLWDIPDNRTNQLMRAFHAELVSGSEPAIALAHAQRRFGESKSAWWSGFVLITVS